MNARRWWIGIAGMLLCACQPAPRSLEAGAPLPQKLSDWRLVTREQDRLVLNPELMAYDLNSALFSDYAHKLRAVFVPRGTSIRYGDDDFEFPVGTVITKTFYYPRAGTDSSAVRKDTTQTQTDSLDLRSVRLLETRLLINTPRGWVVAPYVWNEEQTEATLQLAGDSISLTLVSDAGAEPFEYQVPDSNQCANCHATDYQHQLVKPIGIRARHLNKNYTYRSGVENQLDHWRRVGLLQDLPATGVPRNAQWDVPSSGDLNARARAYLEVNCAHCHSAHAAANPSGMFLDIHETEPENWGVCKMPVASGRGSGNAAFDIVPGKPDDSILLYRMESNEPDIAMPELGRAVVHSEGVALIRQWIASLPGSCAG